MRSAAAALALSLAVTQAACVTEPIQAPRTTWELSSVEPAIALGAEPEFDAGGGPGDDDLLDLFTEASEQDLSTDFVAGGTPSPFHRLGHNVIRGLDGSWTKLYTVRAGRAPAVVDLMRAYVPEFPALPGVPNDPALPPGRLIKYSVQSAFYTDETQENFGVRSRNADPSISDVIHVTAPPNVLLFIDELLGKVLADLPQVEIEILVVEVNLSDEIDWDAKLKAARLTDPRLPFDPVTNPPVGNFGDGLPILDGGTEDGSGAAFSSVPGANAALPGFLLSLQALHGGTTFRGVLSLLQTIGAAELLSSPKITVLNGHRAKLTTGDKLPILETKGTVNNPTVSTTFEPTGVTIDLVPYIVSENLIRIDLSIEVSSQTGSVPLVLSGVDVSSPIISQRTAGTTLHVYSDQTFALGGLKASSRVESMTKVPLLGDIPLLGWLFKSRLSETRKTEVLFFVRPTIKLPSDRLVNPADAGASLIDPGGARSGQQ